MATVKRIVKSYGRKISCDWKTWDFHTTMEKEFDAGELDTKEKMLEENKKLFDQVKALTELDIQRYQHEIVPSIPEKK